MNTFTATAEIKPYSTKEIAMLYGVCDKTLKKWLKPFEEYIGKKTGRYYTIAQVNIIFDKLGMPGV
jgi:transposase-like protein